MTNTEHPNALLILQCWQAVSHSDPETLRALWSEDIVWHVTVKNPRHGDHEGPDAILDYLSRIGEINHTYELTLQGVIANEEYGIVTFHVDSELDGRTLSADQILFGKFKERRLTEIWTLALDPGAVQEFWQL